MRRLIEPRTVLKLVSMPPSQRWLTYGMPAAHRRGLHRFARRALGADEQHAAAVCDDLTNESRRLVVQRQRLLEIDDVDPVTFPEDELSHLGVPEAGLMSEMNARFQHLPHGHAGHDQVSCRG